MQGASLFLRNRGDRWRTDYIMAMAEELSIFIMPEIELCYYLSGTRRQHKRYA